MKKRFFILTISFLFALTLFAGCQTVSSTTSSSDLSASNEESTNQESSSTEDSSTVETFIITWVVNGEESTTEVESGVTPVYEGTPTKEATESKTFTFAGWDTDPLPATSNATYVAIFNEQAREYTVTWIVD